VARIRVMTEEQATGDVAKAYEAFRADGMTPTDSTRMFSLLPDAMKPLQDFRTALFYPRDPTRIDARRRKLVGLVVSSLAGCKTCVVNNGTALQEIEGATTDKIRALLRDWRSVDLDPFDRAILSYAEVLALDPARTQQMDIDELRAAGLDDRDILHLTSVIAYYVFWSRIGTPLGYDDEARLEESELLAGLSI
jgi:uncharacterized peroxidase-related enzyme